MEKHACGHVPGFLPAEKTDVKWIGDTKLNIHFFEKTILFFRTTWPNCRSRWTCLSGDGEPAAAPGKDRGAQRNGILQKERFQDSPWVGRFLRPGPDESRPRYPGRDPRARVSDTAVGLGNRRPRNGHDDFRPVALRHQHPQPPCSARRAKRSRARNPASAWEKRPRSPRASSRIFSSAGPGASPAWTDPR